MRARVRVEDWYISTNGNGGDLGGQQIVHALIDGGTGLAQKLDPSGRVDENHEFRWARISSRSPIQPEPRSFRASSSPSGSAASVRNAKLMASRFVANWYRRITVAHASSSMSTFVRVIHQRYTTRPQVSKPRVRRPEALVEATRLLCRLSLGDAPTRLTMDGRRYYLIVR